MDNTATLLILLVTIIIVSSANLTLSLNLFRASQIVKLLNLLYVIIICQCILKLVADLFFPTEAWSKIVSPFALLYGPILYLMTLTSKQKNILSYKQLLHFFPFFIATVYYIATIVTNGELGTEGILATNIIVLTAISLSMSVYTTLPFYKQKSNFMNEQNAERYLVIASRVLMAFISILIFTVLLNKDFEENEIAASMIRIFIHICFLLIVILLFAFNIYQLKKKVRFNRPSLLFQPHAVLVDNRNKKYNKSLISETLMNSYADKLEIYAQNELFFKDPNISLELLAKRLKIPPHHLSQLFNIKLGKTFNTYINELRIDFASKILIEKLGNSKMEEIALASGFTSRASFNRQFKQINQCTPSEFISVHVKNSGNSTQ